MGFRVITLLAAAWLALLIGACTNGPVVVRIPEPAGTALPEPTVEHPPLLPPAPMAAGQHFGGIVFSEHITGDGLPTATSINFAGGTRQVWALSSYAGMREGAAWRREWKRNGQVVSAVSDTWLSGEGGSLTYPFSDPLGLTGGAYTFSLFLDGRLAQEGSFTVGERPVTPAGQGDVAEFGSLIFAQDVTADGHPVNPAESFDAGISRVWAYFMVRNPDPALPWRLLWERDGAVALDDRQDTRENASDGWFAFALDDDNGLASGHYTLTLSVADVVAQQAVFDVTPPAVTPAPAQRPAAFGPIVFAQAADAQNEVVDPAVEFDAGLTRVYASFFYLNMRRGQTWTREWLRDGEPLLRKDAAWDLAADGVDAISLEDRGGLVPGIYTLNLYVAGQLVRHANFSLRNAPAATDLPPSRPEDLIERDLLPAWRILAGSNSETMRRLARFSLIDHIPIRFGELSAPATYRHSSTLCRTEAGVVLVSRAYWSRASWDEVAATLAHELTHAAQMLSADYACDCSHEREMQAFSAEMFQLQTRSRKDLLQQNFSYAYDAKGKFSQTLLWFHVRKVYSGCKLRG